MSKSLGAMLAVCLAGLQFLAVLAVVSSSYLTSERALIQHARDLLRDVGINTIEHSKGFLGPAEGAAELAARLAQNRVIASDDPQLLERLLFQQLQIAPQFAGLYFGSEEGSFVYVMRSPNEAGPFRTKLITIGKSGERNVTLIWRNDEFNIVAMRNEPEDTFDPRTRPWYRQATLDQATIWTDPYIFFSSRQPGITLAAPVRNEIGALRGVVGVDIEISAISHFLARLNIGDNGKAMIIHSNGDVIAHPDANLIRATNDGDALRFANITEFEDPIARTAFMPLMQNGEFLVDRETQSQFDYQGESYVSTIMPTISEHLPWTIAVYAPESDFTAVIKANRTTNIWIAALVAMISGIAGLMLANYIHQPVRAFAVRSALIAQGEIDASDPAPKTYRELEKANAALVQQIVARREAEREYGQTFDLSSRGMAQISPEGRLLKVNARFCCITGRTEAELHALMLADLLPPVVAETWPWAEEGPTDFAMNREMMLRRPDGQPVWVSVNAIVIHDQIGRPLHAVVTLDDITESKNRDGQIVQLNRDLSHLARGHTMGQLAAGLAHELNQPLTAIAQNADTALLVLAQHPATDAELKEILTEVERQSLRAGEIIRALRGFIRKDEGGRSGFDFCQLVEQALRLVQAEAAEAEVQVHTDLPPALPAVMGNRVQIAQVLVNLLRNAIEALAQDPDLSPRQVHLSARSEGEMMVVTVTDTGPGVQPGMALFTQFETSKPGGMGLGLSICRSIVEAGGGQLWYEPVAEQGARFVFTLPLSLSRGPATA